jgi:mRNA interferase RelE/StbE
MKTVYRQSFEKDIKRPIDKKIRTNLLALIREIKECNHMSEVKNIKKIKGVKKFYRIKVGEYRLGIKIESQTVTFIRFLHRKDIYRYFP